MIYKNLDLIITGEVLKDIGNERIRQHFIWGMQDDLSWGEWLAILGEEHGEVCQSLAKLMKLQSVKASDAGDPYEECIQAAAVLAKMAELLKMKGY